MLDISCEKCESHICHYQKDGPGILKRLYLDRITGLVTDSEKLTCLSCKEVLGIKIVYKKEDRPAYRLFAGSTTKKLAKKVP